MQRCWLCTNCTIAVIMSSNLKSTLPTLPITIIDMVLSFIPTSNRIMWEDRETNEAMITYVDGLLPYVVFNLSLLLPHYKSFDSKWMLLKVAKAMMKPSLLEEAPLIHCIKLHVTTYHSSGFRPLTILPHPHQLKSVDLSFHSYADSFLTDDFIDTFMSLAPACTNLSIRAPFTTSSNRRIEWPRSPLKKVCLDLIQFPAFFNSGFFNSIPSLRLFHVPRSIGDTQSAYRHILDNLPSMLSQLPCLYELRTTGFRCDKEQFKGLPKVHSTSLRSLHADKSLSNRDSDISFLGLFADCPIDSLDIYSGLLEKAIRLFPNIRYLRFWVSSSIIVASAILSRMSNYNQALENYLNGLYERKEDGNLAFPR